MVEPAGDARLAFDLLALEGEDLRGLPLKERKARLRSLLSSKPPLIGFVDHVETRGTALFAQVEALGLEGVMAKRGDSPYRAGRSEDWLKICVDRRADLVVVGFSLSLLLAGAIAVGQHWWHRHHPPDELSTDPADRTVEAPRPTTD